MGQTNEPAPGGLPLKEKTEADARASEDATVMHQVAVAAKPPEPPTPTIEYADFAKLDIRVGLVTTAERVPKSKKLIRMNVDFGDQIGSRVICAGIGDHPDFDINKLLHGSFLFLVNIAPREIIKGAVSHGMMLAATAFSGQPIPATCGVSPGARVG